MYYLSNIQVVKNLADKRIILVSLNTAESDKDIKCEYERLLDLDVYMRCNFGIIDKVTKIEELKSLVDNIYTYKLVPESSEINIKDTFHGVDVTFNKSKRTWVVSSSYYWMEFNEKDFKNFLDEVLTNCQ